MEPLWVKVRDTDTTKAGNSEKKKTFNLAVLSLQFRCLDVFIMRHGLLEKTGKLFRRLLITDATPVYPD